MSSRHILLVLPLLLAAGCLNPTVSAVDRAWDELEADARSAEPLADPSPERVVARQDRARRVREAHAGGALSSARDHLRAAVLLAESDDPADWALGAELGRRAADLGEPLGLRAAAEAIDKDLVHQGRPQRYGTQFRWDPLTGSWRLYPIDPATTDAERAAMGVPSYGELVAAEAALGLRASRGR
jgi:hypothetical protein